VLCNASSHLYRKLLVRIYTESCKFLQKHNAHYYNEYTWFSIYNAILQEADTNG